MKRLFRLVIVLLSLFVFVSCDGKKPTATPTPEFVDYVSQVKLTKDFVGKDYVKDGIGEVTLYNPVDGDTIHVKDKAGKILKLRFFGVDTPESTAQVEAWGVAASNFTKNIVKNCKSIVIMTDDGLAGSNTMDTYERYLCWVWYKMDDNSDYRLLNLELVQVGYSRSKNADVINFREELIAAADQARNAGIKIWGETDPNYCYTEAKELTLKAIVEDINDKGTNSQYYLKKVIFTAQVVGISQQSTYYLNYTDPETGEVYGIQAYHRDSQTGYMKIGVTVRLSGTLTYYETGQVFQITDIVDKLLTSKVDNIKVIEEAKPIEPTLITGADIDTNDKNLKFNVVKLEGLKVTNVYTTTADTSSSKGAMTITCEDANGDVVTIRTDVLFDKTGKFEVDNDYKVVQSNFEGKTIDVVGVIEMYEGNYQVKVVSVNDFVIH